MIQINDQAPSFTLKNEKGESISLSDFKGQKVVIYFYPKDFTPGCKNQACTYRDHQSQFIDLNVKVIGISRDNPESHQLFKDKYQLNFELLSDSDGTVSEAYGVKKLLLVQRTTFILDENHIITHIFEKTNPKTDSERVLEVLRKEA